MDPRTQQDGAARRGRGCRRVAGCSTAAHDRRRCGIGRWLRGPQQQHLREAPRVRDGRGRPGAPGGVPEDRGQQRRPVLPRHPGRRHRGLCGQRRLRRRAARGRRVRGDPRPGRVRVHVPGGRCPSSRRTRRTTRAAPSPAVATGEITGQVVPGRHQRGGRSGLHQRLRGRGLRRPRLQRSGRHRPDPARHLLLRAEGAERRARRRRSRDHLQPGRHPGPGRTVRRRRHEPGPPIRSAGLVDPAFPWSASSFADGVALAEPGSTAFVEVLPPETRTDHNVIAELPGQERGQRRDGRRAPRQRHRGAGDQRQRFRFGRDPRDGADDGEHRAGEHAAVRLVGRGGAGPARLGRLRRGLVAGRAEPHRALHELRHGRFAELHLHGVRRRPVDVPGPGRRPDPGGLGGDRGRLRVVLHRTSGSPTTTRSSPGAATTRPSSSPASRRAGCSRAPRGSRRRSRRRSGAAPPATSSTRATTRPATPSRTSTCTRWTSTAT